MRQPSLPTQVLAVFDDGRRVRALGLVGLMFVGALLETVGVGLILPFIAIIAEPSIIETNPWMARLYALAPVSDATGFFWLFAALMLVFYVFKNVCVGAVVYISNAVIFGRMHVVFTRLLSRYMHAPYTFHLTHSSSDLQRNINHDVVMAFNWVVSQCFFLLRDALLVAALLVLLLAVEPAATLAAAVAIGVPGLLFYLLTRNSMVRLGEDERRQYALMIKWVSQGIGGIKEAKILGTEDYFVETFAGHAGSFARTRRTMLTVNELPRLVLETIAVGSILVVVLVTASRGSPLQAVLPSLAMFGVAAFRVLPAATRSIRAIGLIRHHRGSLQQVWHDLNASRELQGIERDTGQKMRFGDALELDDVEVRYDEDGPSALKGVSLTIRRGEAVAFVGPSGAGKTTAVDALLGLLPIARGRVLVDGRDIAERRTAWQGRCGYIPQQIYLIDDTIRQNVAFGVPADDIDDERVLAALRASQLDAFVASLPEGLDTNLGENGVRLSGGQRQRIGIARSLYPDPDVLVLDEATAALDPESEAAVSDAIVALAGDKTLIVVAHRMSTVRRCDRLFFLEDGRLAATGTFAELVESCPRFRAMAGIDHESAPSALAG